MSQEKNAARYREAVAAALDGAKGPVIPFVGVHLKDLFFIEQGNSDFVDGKLNWDKLQMVARVVGLFQRCQDTVNQHYSSFRLDPEVERQFRTFMVPPPEQDDVLYELSVQLEPVGERSEENVIN